MVVHLFSQGVANGAIASQKRIILSQKEVRNANPELILLEIRSWGDNNMALGPPAESGTKREAKSPAKRVSRM
jgi:hypothetical protein